jgi:hypothetical protein
MMQTFLVEAVANPQSLPRILEHFAQRSMIPTRLSAVLEGDMLRVEIVTADIELPIAELIGARIEEGVMVASVVLKPPAARAGWPRSQGAGEGRRAAA